MTYPYDPNQPPVVSGPPAQPYPAPQQPQPYSAPPPQQQFYPAPQPPPKKSAAKPILIGLGVILGLCMIGGVVSSLNGGDSDTGTAATDAAGSGQAAKQPAKKKAKQLPGMGTPVRDGKFEFVVNDLDCSKSTLGGQFSNSKAQGKFCVVSVKVTNIGKEAQMFTGADQKAYDVKGAQYTNDGSAEFDANESNETFLNDINPGNSVKGNVVFDVPQDVVLTTVELHDSMFSGGVKVSLK